MSKVVLGVPEISCGHCAHAITTALAPQAGVKQIRVDIPTRKVHLEFDEHAITLDRVREILAKEDYAVAAVEAG
jgi:copper chaperone